MQAKDIMSTPVQTIGPDATVADAAALMLKHQLSCLPVVNDKGKLVGILTHTDFELHRRFTVLADNLFTLLGSWATPKTLEEVAHKARTTLVKEVMKRRVSTVNEATPINEIVETMLNLKVHRLPVMRGEKLVGIITRHDLLKLLMAQPPEAVKKAV